VTGTTLADLAPLPPALIAALEAFVRTHGCADLRLWGENGDGKSCLHPNGADGDVWPAALRMPIDLPDGVRLEVEVQGGTPDENDLAFLGHTIQQILTYEREARSAARELTERYEEINLLYFISEILASVLSIPDAAHWILAEVAESGSSTGMGPLSPSSPTAAARWSS
jgi:hypothetical protein